MATTATSRPSPSHRQTPSRSSPTPNSIARGATARSAVSPKVNASLNGITRRPSSRSTSSHGSVSPESDRMTRESLLTALKRETEEKEELLVRIQNKEQSLAELAAENCNLTSAFNAAEGRLTELYAEQARMEEETAARLDLVDRLRAQVQELEREKRDVLRRYNEQTVTFDAERQSFYDNEQHLKSRIQSLVQARKVQVTASVSAGQDDEQIQSDAEDQSEQEQKVVEPKPVETGDDDEDEPAEMTALRLELSTLSTSYSSLQTTVQHLSAQLLDLKRVNNQLQEENESYNILLREKTLNGQFDILRTVGTRDSDDDDDADGDDEDAFEKTDRRSLRSIDKTPLDPVDEVAEDMDSTLLDDASDQSIDDKALHSSRTRERSRRQGRGRRADASHSPAPKGESLADLPITGPGLDLAAELGRAENLAILEGRTQDIDDRDRSITNGVTKTKRSKRASADWKPSEMSSRGDISASGSTDIDALRNEVKSLKDANKALSLYASKIIDRIIAQEGFEHVLAVDYDNSTQSKEKSAGKTISSSETSPRKKARPQSAIALPRPSPVLGSADSPQSNTSSHVPSEPTVTSKAQRRSLSFDWKSFSVFGGGTSEKKDSNPNLRPLNLRPGAAVVGARKLDTQEDEDDRRERERMNAVLKLMGIEKPDQPVSPIVTSPTPTGNGSGVFSSEPTSPRPQSSRFSFFRSKSTNSDNGSANSGNNSSTNMNLTQEALERAEAETSLAALDEREKVLSAEIAKGSSGGFTELPRRNRGEEWRSKRSKRSGESGSGSTVWSAGMSTHREADSSDERAQGRSDA